MGSIATSHHILSGITMEQRLSLKPIRTRLTAAALTMGMLASLGGSALASECLALDPPPIITGTLNTLNDEAVKLSQFEQGIQSVILANRRSSTQAESASEGIEIEFGRYEFFRQVVVVDGRGLQMVQDLAMSMVRDQLPHSSGSPFIGFDFEGNLVENLSEIAAQVLPDLNLKQEAVLLIVDGQGQVLSVHNLSESSLLVRQCLREQIHSIWAKL